MVDIWDDKVTKKAATLPDEVEVQSPDGSPLDGEDAEPCVIVLDNLIKQHLAQKMLTGKQSFETIFMRHLSSAVKSYIKNHPVDLDNGEDSDIMVETANEGDTE